MNADLSFWQNIKKNVIINDRRISSIMEENRNVTFMFLGKTQTVISSN